MSSTLGIKLDDATRRRLKNLAQSLDREPHWVIKTALMEYLERVMQWLDALAEGRREPCAELSRCRRPRRISRT